jgi:hypothetical protein
MEDNMVKDDKAGKNATGPISTEGKTVGEVKPKKIMTEPLPQILDEIEDSIRLANEAARDARKAAEEARRAGEKAATEAARVAAETIFRVEKIAKEAMELARLLNSAIIEAAASVERKLTGKT